MMNMYIDIAIFTDLRDLVPLRRMIFCGNFPVTLTFCQAAGFEFFDF